MGKQRNYRGLPQRVAPKGCRLTGGGGYGQVLEAHCSSVAIAEADGVLPEGMCDPHLRKR